jgi:hypothetical protein
MEKIKCGFTKLGEKSGRISNKILIFFGIVLIVAAFIVGGVLENNRNVPDMVSIMDIEGKINDIGELATAEYIYTISNVTEKPNKELIGLKIPFTSSQIIYSYEGIIKAGIDFVKIEIGVNENNKTISIKLPDAQILSSEVANDSLIIYDEKNNPLNNFSFSDLNLAIVDIKQKAEETAIAKGLLIRSQENAESIIRSTIESFYSTEEYSLEFY